MDQNKKLLNKEVAYCAERKCLLITETHETEVSEKEILQRVQNIDYEIDNLEREIERLRGVIEGRKLERTELLKYISTTIEPSA